MMPKERISIVNKLNGRESKTGDSNGVVSGNSGEESELK